MARFQALLTWVGRALRGVGSAVFGRVAWQPPAWVTWTMGRGVAVGRHLRSHRLHAAGLLVVLVATGFGIRWYINRPKPHYTAATVQAPGLTTFDENGVPTYQPLRVTFAEPVAPLQLVQKEVRTGLTLSPDLPGKWTWLSDHELEFAPQDDWPVDGRFSLHIDERTALDAGVHLESDDLEFVTPPFTAQISESQFYQDPRDPNLKKLVATVRFSHPVDAQAFESHVALVTATDATYLGLGPDSRHFTVLYDKLRLAAFVHSAALSMPSDDTPLTLRVNQGVRAARGGNGTAAPMEAVVTIPGRTSLRFTSATMTVVDNARYEPEQLMLLTSSSPVSERAFDGQLSVRLLPRRHPRQPENDRRAWDWNADREIGRDILDQAAPVEIAYVPSEEGGGTSHGFRFKAPVGRYLHVTIRDGVQGIGGYVSSKPFVTTIHVERYPQALTFLGEGALLSMSGDRQVGFMVRDVDVVEVEVARVLPNQLQHLAPYLGSFARPEMYDGIEDRLVERFITTRDYSGQPPGKPVYDSINLGEYLQDRQQARRGLFLLHVKTKPGVEDSPAFVAPNPDEPAEPGDPDGGGENDEGGDVDGFNGYDREVADTRLVLVTDIGFIVKQANDGTRQVFVQSIRTGSPIEAARVEVMGANGLPALAATTDASGVAALPRFVNLPREKRPIMILVQKDGDVSFMPFSTGGRALDLSRFDTGGVDNVASAQELESYLFSDRGIYRPGETTHLGMVVRTADWRASLAGLPVVVEISDPRGATVSRTDVRLSPSAFEEITFTSQPAAPTGIYQATAFLVKDANRREAIGTTSFTLQEFEPDRLKVRLDLTETPTADGWLRPDAVAARVHADHLFGEPAANRRVEAELSLTAVLPRFARYPDYRFSIGDVITEPYQETLASTVTDNQGNARFELDLRRFTGRAYRLNVLARTFEAEGGRNVAAQNSAIVSDAPFLVGVKADGELAFVPRGGGRDVRWLAVNAQLESVAAGNLTLEWVQRKFVSVLTRQSNGTMRYVSQLRETVRNSRTVAIAAGGTVFPLPSQEPGDFVLVLRNPNGTELNRVSYSVAGQANLSRSLERNAELQVQLDRPSYGPGDTIAVNIRAPYTGAGLITIERDRVYTHRWFRTSTTGSVQRITVPADFSGNGYVSVQFVRDPASDQIFLSPLSYGVAPFAADTSTRTQTLTLTAAPQVRPGAPLAIRVTPGEASRVAVIAVDEGILQVARYRNPDPLGYFFQKRRLEVDTRQILDLILPEFRQFKAAAPGGDADAGFARHLNPFNRKRKAPVAFWSGIIDVPAGGREVRYTVPDYFNGRLRLIAVAVSAGRMAVADAATEVKGDFILTPNVPAMVAPGDEFLVSVGVFNNAGGSGTVRVEVQPGRGVVLAGPAGVDLSVAEKAEGVAEFRLRADAAPGSAPVTFVARRDALNARMEETISVRPAVPFRTHVTLGRLDGASVSVPLTRTLFSEFRNVTASVSLLPLVWGQGLTAYLQGYEYSCTEQLVSKGVAALVLSARPEFGTVDARSGPRPLDATFNVIRARSNDSGGLGLWTSTPETAEFPSVYAAHLLVDTRDRAQPIPADVLNRLNDWLARFASTPAPTLAGGRMRAYAVYLLARQGIRASGALANVEQELANRHAATWKTDLAAAYVAATYRLLQRTADAEALVAGVPWAAQKPATSAADEDVYYDDVVHDAQLLYLLARHFPARVSATPTAALEAMGRAISSDRLTSLSAAYTLLALDGYARATSASATLGLTEVGRDNAQRALRLPVSTMPRVALSEAAASMLVSKTGALPAYYALTEAGFDRNPPSTALSQGIEVIREFVDAKGNPLPRVAVGDEFFIRLRLRATGRDRIEQVAVVDLLPGGSEAVLEVRPPSESGQPGLDPAMAGRRSSALPVGVPALTDWTPHHVDLREDRLVLYGTVTRSVSTFVYRVRANNAGAFTVPPAYAEGMYQRAMSGWSAAATLQVVKP